MSTKVAADDLKVEGVPLRVKPVTDYDPFEAKFCASLYWLVFRTTEDNAFDNIPSQVTSPIQRDAERRISIRPEVVEFLANGEVYCRVCDAIFHNKEPVMGHWAVIQSLSRHGFYVIEDGDIAVTDSALQQRKPFRKSTHLALMDALMAAYSSQVISVEQVVQAVRKFASFNASRELPFDLEDSLLLWINKICANLNEGQLKKQKLHAEQLLLNQDKAKRFRFRRDQLQPKVQSVFPVIDDLLKDLSDGQCLLGIVMFYHPETINTEDVHFGKELSSEQIVHNIELFRSLCSQHICTSALSLQVEDFMYSSHAMKPNIVALLAEVFFKCEIEENTLNEETKPCSKSAVSGLSTGTADKRLTYHSGISTRSSSAPMLASDIISATSPALGKRVMDLTKAKAQRSASIPEQLSQRSDGLHQEKDNITPRKSLSETEINAIRYSAYNCPFQLDFTNSTETLRHNTNDQVELDSNGAQDLGKDVNKQNPFSGIFQKPVLARESRKYSAPSMLAGAGSPRMGQKAEARLSRREKQKPRTLALDDWEMGEEDMEELHVTDLQRSQSLTGLDQNSMEPRQSFHAWQEGSSSETNLALNSTKSARISVEFRPNQSMKASQKQDEGRGIQSKSGLRAASKVQEDFMSEDSLVSCSPKSTDSLNTKPSALPCRRDGLTSESYRSDASERELNEFEEMEAMIKARGSSEVTNTKNAKNSVYEGDPADEDLLNASVSSEDMNRFRLEVLQRLTQDKLRDIEHDRARDVNDEAAGQNGPTSGTHQRNSPDGEEEGDEHPTRQVLSEDMTMELLSPITETTEPAPSVTSLPESVPSTPASTAPSSPCSPLDVAPFTPSFFMTSPANTIEKTKYKKRADKGQSLLGDNIQVMSGTDATGEPLPSKTPRLEVEMRSNSPLTRGSYTVDQMSADAAQAAGIPVIGLSSDLSNVSNVHHGQVLRNTPRNMSVSDPHERTLVESPQAMSFETGLHGLMSASSNQLPDKRESRTPPKLARDAHDSLDNSPANSPNVTRRSTQLRDSGQTKTFSPTTIDDVIFDRKSSDKLQNGNAHVQSAAARGSHVTEDPFQTYSRKKKPATLVFDFNQETFQNYSSDAQGSPLQNNAYNDRVMTESQRVSYIGIQPLEGQFEDNEDYINYQARINQGQARDPRQANHGHYSDRVGGANAGRSNDQCNDGVDSSRDRLSHNQNPSRDAFAGIPGFHSGLYSHSGDREDHLPNTDQYGTYNKYTGPQETQNISGPRRFEESDEGVDNQIGAKNSSLGRFATFRKPPGSPGVQIQPPGSPVIQREPPGSPVIQRQSPGSPVIQRQSPGSPVIQKQPPGSPVIQRQPPGSPVIQRQSPGSSVIQRQPPGSPVIQRKPPGSPVIQRHPSPQTQYEQHMPPNPNSYKQNFLVSETAYNPHREKGDGGAIQAGGGQSIGTHAEGFDTYRKLINQVDPARQNLYYNEHLPRHATEYSPYQSPRNRQVVMTADLRPQDSSRSAHEQMPQKVTDPRIPERHSYAYEDPSSETPDRKSQAFTVDVNTGAMTDVNNTGKANSPRSPASSIVRSRTFRKRPEGRMFEPEVVISPRQRKGDVEMSPQVSDREPAVVLRRQKEGSSSNSTHRISWSDSAEGLKAVIQDGITADMKGKHSDKGVPSTHRHASPSSAGRSSPGARISWVTAARSGFGGQVMLNDKGKAV